MPTPVPTATVNVYFLSIQPKGIEDAKQISSSLLQLFTVTLKHLFSPLWLLDWEGGRGKRVVKNDAMALEVLDIFIKNIFKLKQKKGMIMYWVPDTQVFSLSSREMAAVNSILGWRAWGEQVQWPV